MTGIRRHRRLSDSQLFWLSFFLFVGTAAGTIFCNHMSMEMKNTLEQWFAGIFAPAELSSVDYYSLFAGILKKRFVWILVGILICQTSLSGIICYASAVCVSFQASVIVCALTMHSGFSGILLFFGLVFPQGIFYALAACLTHASRTIEAGACSGRFSGGRVSNAWVTCLIQGDSSWKRLVKPHKRTVSHDTV